MTRLKVCRPDPDDAIIEFVETEDNALALRCAAVMTAWAEAGEDIPGEDDKRAVLDRMEASNLTPCRVLELLEDDLVAVDIGGRRKEILAFVDDLAVGDFVGVNLYRHGISKLDSEEAMVILAEKGKHL